MFVYLLSVLLFIYGFILIFIPFYTLFCQLNGYFLFEANLYFFYILEFLTFYLNFLSFFLDDLFGPFFFSSRLQLFFLSENFSLSSIYFTPVLNTLWISIGHPVLTFYELCNDSSIDSYVIYTIYNISPVRMGLYFNKIECFCFEEQYINPLSCYFLPIFFYIDSSVLLDFNIGYLNTLTITYILI